MKKIIQKILILSCFVSLLVSSSVAQTVTLSPSATASTSPTIATDKDIENLKEKIANKVSEIRKENNKAVSGFIISKNENIMKISDNKEENQVKLDDALTKYFQIVGTKKKEIKTEDIKKDDYAIVSGVMADNIITANIVLIDENFLTDSGIITEINKDSYNVKILSSDKNTYSIDIETYTKQFMVNIKTLNLEQIGFSKLKEGDNIHFVVKKTGLEKDNNYSATKILIVPQEYFIK